MKPRLLLTVLALAAVSGLVVGCGSDRSASQREPGLYSGQNSKQQSESFRAEMQQGRQAVPAAMAGAPGAPEDTQVTTTVNVNQPAGRKIIYTADVSLVVQELEPLEKALASLVRSSRGFVAGHNISGSSTEPREAVWRIRIPVGRFDGFLEAVKQLGELQSIDLSSEDVTDQYIDLDARIRTKKRQEERLLVHLDRSTTRLQDILTVEGELTRVRGEIELAEGSLRQLKDQTDYTTVTLTAREVAAYKPPRRTTFGDRIVRQLSTSGSAVLSLGEGVVLFGVGLLPWMASLALLALPLAAWWRKR